MLGNKFMKYKSKYSSFPSRKCICKFLSILFIPQSLCRRMVLRPEYFRQTRSLPFLLMPWLLASPDHQQQLYGLCRIKWFLSSTMLDFNYCQISKISGTKSQNLNVSHLGLQLSLRNILKPGVKMNENENIVGAAPTGDAPTASEWSTF